MAITKMGDGPASAEGLLEAMRWRSRLPTNFARRNVADGDYGECVETGANQQRQSDDAQCSGALQFGFGFFYHIWGRTRAGEKIGNDLHGGTMETE